MVWEYLNTVSNLLYELKNRGIDGFTMYINNKPVNIIRDLISYESSNQTTDPELFRFETKDQCQF